MTYEYVCVISGHVEADGEKAAERLVQHGISLSARLLETPNQIAIRLKPLGPATNGHRTKQKGVMGWLRNAAET